MIAKTRERLILDSLDSIVIVLDSTLAITYYNPAFLNTFSLPEGASSIELSSLFTNNDKLLKTIKPIFEGEKIDSKGWFRINNEMFWLDINGFLDKRENEAILIIKDKSKETQLIELKGKFEGLFNFSKIAIAFVGTDGKILMANPAFLDYLGYTATEFYSMAFVDFTYPMDIDIDLAYYTQLINGEIDSYTMDKRYIHKDGRIVWGALTVSVVRNPDPKKTFALGMVEDITTKKESEMALKNYQKELTELVKELQMVNKDLESFAYSISHDLRAPLRYVSSFSTLLKRDSANLPAKSLKYIDYINTGVTDMSGMIDALLQFSRLGRQEIKQMDIDLSTLIPRIISELEAQVQNRKIEWVIGTLPKTSGDYYLIRMVFENLFSNAIKFTKNQEKTIIEIGTKGKSIYVKDNGVGFDMKFKNKLFGVFQRLHKNEDFEGYGIGLANIKRILNRHNATISAEGVLDKGATFYITFRNIIFL